MNSGTSWALDAVGRAFDGSARDVAGLLSLIRRGTEIHARAAVSGSAIVACGRCGEDTGASASADAAFVYLPARPAPAGKDDAEGGEGSHPEVELAEKELDVGWYDGEIDLADVVCEALSLTLPPRLVCAETAACDARTAALIRQGSSGTESTSPFAALKNLRR